MKLALACGRPDVDAMLEELPAGAMEEWWQYYQIQPWGDDWERSSMIAAQISNCILAFASAFGGGKQQEPIEIDAFVPWRHAEESEEDRQAQLAAVDALEVL